MNWNSGILWGIIGLFGGFLISLLFYVIGKKRQRLYYEIETYPIISDKVSQIKGLEIRYHSNEIENLYYSTITIDNGGNTIIEKGDFAPSCPLSISTDGYFLVDENNKMALFSSNRINNISHMHAPIAKHTIPHVFDSEDSALQRKSIIINFDYIAKNEEITCALFHTGKISFNGVLKDGKVINANATQFKEDSFLKLFFDTMLSFLGFEMR